MNQITQISTLDQQITALSARLAPADDAQVAKCLRSLMAAGMIMPSMPDESRVTEVYEFALNGVSSSAINIVTRKLITGAYERERHSFIPTPPEFAAYAKSEQRTIVEDLARLRATREAVRGVKRVEHSEDTKARVRGMIEGFKAKLPVEAAKAKYALWNEGITDEAEYIRRISAIKDQPTITAEQRQFRGIMAKKIELHASTQETAE